MDTSSSAHPVPGPDPVGRIWPGGARLPQAAPRAVAAAGVRKGLVVVQSPRAGWRTLEFRITQKNVACPISLRIMVLSQSNNANGAVVPGLPQVPSRPIIALIRSRLSPYQPESTCNCRQSTCRAASVLWQAVTTSRVSAASVRNRDVMG